MLDLLSERSTPEEEDVYKSLTACLELRERYVFREAVSPWEKEIISDPSIPKPNSKIHLVLLLKGNLM